jgi:hypothetical protein
MKIRFKLAYGDKLSKGDFPSCFSYILRKKCILRRVKSEESEKWKRKPSDKI